MIQNSINQMLGTAAIGLRIAGFNKLEEQKEAGQALQDRENLKSEAGKAYGLASTQIAEGRDQDGKATYNKAQDLESQYALSEDEADQLREKAGWFGKRVESAEDIDAERTVAQKDIDQVTAKETAAREESMQRMFGHIQGKVTQSEDFEKLKEMIRNTQKGGAHKQASYMRELRKFVGGIK